MCEIIEQYARERAEEVEIKKDAEIREIKRVAEQAEIDKKKAIEELREENKKNTIGIYASFIKRGAISVSEAAKELGICEGELELMIGSL